MAEHVYLISTDSFDAYVDHPEHARTLILGLKAIGYGSPEGPAIHVAASSDDAGQFEDTVAERLEAMANNVGVAVQ